MINLRRNFFARRCKCSAATERLRRPAGDKLSSLRAGSCWGHEVAFGSGSGTTWLPSHSTPSQSHERPTQAPPRQEGPGHFCEFCPADGFFVFSLKGKLQKATGKAPTTSQAITLVGSNPAASDIASAGWERHSNLTGVESSRHLQPIQRASGRAESIDLNAKPLQHGHK